MGVIVSEWVRDFIYTLDPSVRSDVYKLIDMLAQYGSTLSMPYAKHLGGGLLELRRTGRPQVRILYGFCKGSAILVHGVKKQQRALHNKDLTLARKRLEWYCAI